MPKYFENAYKGFCSGMAEFLHFASVLGEAVTIFFVYVTLPLWVVPYAIYKKRKER